MFKSFLKFLLFILIWAVIGLVIVGGGILLAVEIEQSVQVYILVFLVWLTYRIIKRIIKYFAAKKRVEELVTLEDGQSENKFSFKVLFGLSSPNNLDERFKKIQYFLRKSKLNEKGDPIYHLPWYLLIGDDDQSKRNFYQKADLTETVIDADNKLSSHGYSFDWFLSNNVILVDAPKSIFGSSSNHYSKEWLSFSKLLRKYRSKECLNGFIVTIDVEQLLSDDRNALRDLGRNWRRQIDEMLRGLTMSVPIYLTVTGLEKIEGSHSWWKLLSDSELRDAFGTVIEQPTAGSKSILEALDKTVKQLKTIQFEAVYRDEVDSSLLLFPQKIQDLRESLDAFTETLFEYSSYQETPSVRGLYFTGLYEQAGEQISTHSKTLLNKILPAQRGLIAPLESAVKKEKAVKTYWRAAWLLVVVLVMGQMYSVYKDNIGYFETVNSQNAGQFIVQNNYPNRIDMLYNMQELILDIDRTMKGWWIPWFNSESAHNYVKELQHVFVYRYEQELGKDINTYLFNEIEIESNKKKKNNVNIGELVSVLSRRIALIEAYLDGQDGDALTLLAAPYDDANWLVGNDLTLEHVDRVNKLYVQYLIWLDDKEKIENELLELKQTIDRLVLASNGQLDWIIEWANVQLRGQDVLLKHFWKSSGRFDNKIKVSPAYTIQGKETIDGLLTVIQHADPIEEEVLTQIKHFRKLYQEKYLDSWANFLKRFKAGSLAFRGRQEFLESVETLAKGDNPFFQVLDESHAQLQPWIDEGVDSQWLELLDYYQSMKQFSPNAPVDNSKRDKTLTKMAIGLLAKAGPVGKALAKSSKSALKSKKKLDKAKGKEADNRDYLLEDAGALLGEYVTSLSDISLNSEIRSVSYLGMVNLFNNPDNPGVGEGPEARAYETVRKLQILLGKRSRRTEPFWSVYAGSVELTMQYMLNETGCYMQEDWQDNVLADIQGLPEHKEREFMLGEEGKLWSFVLEGNGKPFIKKTYGSGFVSKRVKNYKLPFTKNFLSYVNKSGDLRTSGPKEFPIRISASPTGTSKDAIYLPKKTTLTVQCDQDFKEIVNLNFPVSEMFLWNNQCHTVELEIEIGRYVLKKQFTGDKPFIKFMQMFKDNRERFYPKDFPLFEDKLIDNKIKYIDVNYKLRGHKDVFKAQKSLPSATPKNIASCWSTV